MKILDQARSTVTRCMEAGRSKANGLSVKRQHSRLIGELGAARYAQSKGVATSAAEIDRIIAELDALDVSDEHTSETTDAE